MLTHDPLVLDRLLEPFVRCLTSAVARKLVHLRANPEAQARVEQLAEKCNEGRLTPAEREEYQTYVTASNFMAILQSKARTLLARKSKAS